MTYWTHDGPRWSTYESDCSRWRRQVQFGRWAGAVLIIVSVVGLAFVLAGGLN